MFRDKNVQGSYFLGAQGTPTQSHISPSIQIYEDKKRDLERTSSVFIEAKNSINLAKFVEMKMCRLRTSSVFIKSAEKEDEPVRGGHA